VGSGGHAAAGLRLGNGPVTDGGNLVAVGVEMGNREAGRRVQRGYGLLKGREQIPRGLVGKESHQAPPQPARQRGARLSRARLLTAGGIASERRAARQQSARQASSLAGQAKARGRVGSLPRHP